jgi:hypothetical protein
VPGSDAGSATLDQGAVDSGGNVDTTDARPVDTGVPVVKDAGGGDDGNTSTGPCPVSGQILCGGVCIDGQSDPTNCGACGHNCAGQSCVDGACTPIALSTEFTPLGGITQDATTIYFTSAGAVKSVPKAGGTTTTIVSGLTALGLGIAVDSTDAYVALGGQWPGKIVRISLATGTMTDLATAQPGPQAVVIDATNVYWTTYGSGAGNGTVAMCAKAGCNDQPTLINNRLGTQNPMSFGPPVNLVADSTNIYFTSLLGTGELHKAPLGGGPDTTIASSLGSASGLAIANGVLGVAGWGQGGAINTVPTSGGTATLVSWDQIFPISVAITTTDAYWTVYNPQWNSGGQVFKCPLTGCGKAPQILSRNVQPAEGIIADSTHVYWLSNDGSVYKTPL